MERVVIFLSNIQSDTLEDFQSPLGNFLESQQKEDFCPVSSSDCNSQAQRDFLKRTRAIPSAQRQRGGFNPAAWNVPVPSPGFLLASLSCPLLPPSRSFLLWALRNNLGFWGKLSELQNISVGLLKWPLACHLLACCSRNVRVSLSCGRETLSFQVLRMPRGCGWAAKSFGPVFGEEAVWTHWWAGWLVRGPCTFWPPLPRRSDKPELCWEP